LWAAGSLSKLNSGAYAVVGFALEVSLAIASVHCKKLLDENADWRVSCIATPMPAANANDSYEIPGGAKGLVLVDKAPRHLGNYLDRLLI
jgi:hypothetical protein